MSRLLRIALAAALACGVLAASGCTINETDLGDIEEGQGFELGDLRFNVVYDRFLNGQQAEDRDYITGLPPTPAADKDYFGVFVIVKNYTGDAQPLPAQADFKITDTTGTSYAPISTQSLYQFPYGEPIPPHGGIPHPDSAAGSGPTQGALVLFELDQGVTENRPLELQMTSQGEQAQIKLDV